MAYVYDLSMAEELDESSCKSLLGGKGASLVAMHRMELPVPPAFIISTEACRHFRQHGELPNGLREEVDLALKRLEERIGRRLDDAAAPLLLSVRSGAPVSMPGMMDTVLNLGMTGATVTGIAEMFDDERFARDAHRRFLESFGSVVLGIDADAFEAVGRRVREATADAEVLAEIVAGHQELIRSEVGREVPSTAREQLRSAIEAVFRSWDNPRARVYRDLEDIPDDLGTAVTVQAMVFGNLDDRSGTGVAFTRDPNTGEKQLYGDFLFSAQGEDVVSGRHATLPLADLQARLPEVWEQLKDTCARLEERMGDMCDLEFTVEAGRFWMLQFRRGKRAASAAVRIAVELAEEGRISREDAVRRISTLQLGRLFRPHLDPTSDYDLFATGLSASPGLATGRIVLTADDVLTEHTDEPVILVRPETSPSDVHGMALAAGILTTRGGLVSHAAVVARDMGTPAVVGAAEIELDLAAGTVTAGGVVLKAGDLLTIDGHSGEVVAGEVEHVEPGTSEHLDTLLAWADTCAGQDAVPESSATKRLKAAHAALAGEALEGRATVTA